MFSGSRNLFITGGSYVENHQHGAGTRGLELLLEASAPGAFHNSGERFDPPKCHLNTRVAVLAKIMDWVRGKGGWDELIMWLYGPAGAGKSAIAQTTAEQCHAWGILLASFFFSRTDPNRNNEKRLIPTLAYQVAINMPQARALILAAVENDPAVLQRSVEVQLTTLIIEPLIRLSEAGRFSGSTTPVPYLIIIDGLDECQGSQVQQHILHTLSDTLRDEQPPIPLKILIGSRAEHPLSATFSTPQLQEMTIRLALDDHYQPDIDIERYLTDLFNKIIETHPLRAYIPPAWPTNDIRTLVAKASGQFIYAATVIRYISSHHHQLTNRLEIVLGLCPPRADKPFAELDALYTAILSSVDDILETLRVLGVFILSNLDHGLILEAMSLKPGDIVCLFIDLVSVIECVAGGQRIRMLHASFPDFLLDQSRSKEYHINPSLGHAEIARLFLQDIQLDRHNEESLLHMWLEDECEHCSEVYAISESIMISLKQAKPTPELRQALLDTLYITSLLTIQELNYWVDPEVQESILDTVGAFLLFLKTSEFPDTEELYLHHRTIWDKIILERLAGFQLELGLIFFLVFSFIEWDPCYPASLFSDMYRWYFKAPEGELEPHYTNVFQGPSNYSSPPRGDKYTVLLQELFTDPSQAGKYLLDGPKYVIVAKFLLDCYIQPFSLQTPLQYSGEQHLRPLPDLLGILLSKASYSEELIARLNHPKLIFISAYWVDDGAVDGDDDWPVSGQLGLQSDVVPLINEIGNYLLRTVGSVPIGLQLVYENLKGERKVCHYISKK